MRQRRILITGAGGFTGRHLANRLRRLSGTMLVGLDVAAAPLVELDEYLACDLTDADAARSAVIQARPDVVFHLAGLFGSALPERIHAVNVGGFLHLRDALRQLDHNGAGPVRMVVVGSAAELGLRGAASLPVTEDAPCEPQNPYGRSKLEATRLALSEPPDSPVAMIVARPFNLVGPSLSPQLSLGAFALQIEAVLRGEADAVCCGNLDSRRDYVDVRDAADAYVALAERGRAGQLYNVCAGRSYRIGDLLDGLIAATGRQIPIQVDPSRCRSGDLADIYGSHAKITRHTGWQPRTAIRRSLADLLHAVPL